MEIFAKVKTRDMEHAIIMWDFNFPLLKDK